MPIFLSVRSVLYLVYRRLYWKCFRCCVCYTHYVQVDLLQLKYSMRFQICSICSPLLLLLLFSIACVVYSISPEFSMIFFLEFVFHFGNDCRLLLLLYFYLGFGFKRWKIIVDKSQLCKLLFTRQQVYDFTTITTHLGKQEISGGKIVCRKCFFFFKFSTALQVD